MKQNIEPQSNFVTIGKIVNSFGVKGFVKIKTDNADCSSLNKYKQLYLFIDNTWTAMAVESGFAKDNILNIKFENCNDRDQALALKGTLVAIERNQLPELGENEYYFVDLIGLSVYNKQNEYFGIVDSLMETGANGVLVVINADKQHLIPFVAQYIHEVDIAKRQIIVDWGLDY